MNNSDNLFDTENLVADLIESDIDLAIGTDNTLLGIEKKESSFIDPLSSKSSELSLVEEAIAKEREKKENTGDIAFNPSDLKIADYSGGYSGGRSITGNDEGAETVNPEASIAHSAENFAVAAEGRVSINGRSDFDGIPEDTTDDALIYAGLGFTINGNQTLPVQRDENGNPLRDSSNRQILVDNAVAVSENYQSLNAGAASSRYSGLIPPQIVDAQTIEIPEYSQLLQERLSFYIDENTTEIEFDTRNNRINNLSQWNSKFPAPGTVENPTVVRVIGGGLNIPNRVELDNYIITVEQGDINFNGSNHRLNNVTLITENGNMNLSSIEATNSAILAARTINMNSGARFGGETLIANNSGSINFNGATITVEETDNLRVVSARDLTFNGATDTRGQFLATNNFTFNGRSTLYGSIGAKNDVIINGNATVIGISEPEPIIPNITIEDLNVTEGDSGTQTANFTVSLSEANDRVITVDYDTNDVIAVAGEDYSAISGTLSFAPGEISKTIDVSIVGDSVDEFDESFTLNLSNPSNGIIAKEQAIGTIIDNDEPPSITIDDVTVIESDSENTEVEFTISLSAPSSKTITLDYTTEELTATSGVDYETRSGSLTFTPGEISKIVTVSVIGDISDELDEAFDLSLSNPDNATISKNRGTGTILDNDLAPELAIFDLSITETDSGTNNAIFTVSLSAASSLPVSVEYATSDGEAVAGIDYQAVSGVVDFAPGETTKTIAVPIIGDTLDEPDKAFSVNLNNASNATINIGEAIGTIVDNDEPPSIGINDITISESGDNTNANFTVTLSEASDFPITVDFTTVDDTAIAGEDYTATNGTVTFAPGETTTTISVPVLEDSLNEIDEAFSIELSNPTNATIDDGAATVTITDNDLPPSASIDSISVEETDSETVTAVFIISLDSASGKEITLDYETIDGTAIAGEDYQGISGSLTFSPGETVKTLSVAILGDTIDEITEAFTLDLSNPSNVALNQASGTGTIIDNDNPPEIAIADISLTESNLGMATATLIVNLSKASSKPISIDFTTVDNTATAGFDYVANSDTISFAPGETNKTIEIELIGDNLDEFDEAFGISLSNPVNVTVSDSNATITITDNDNPPSASIDSISLTEDDGGTTNASFTVSLSQASGKPISIDFTTVEGTAIAGVDYVANSGTLTFAPGETLSSINVAVIGDTLNEIDEAFSIELANPNFVTISEDTGIATIIDNDLPPSVTVADIAIVEGNDGTSNAVFTFNLSNPSSLPIAIDYSTVDGIAIAGLDYTATSGTIAFAPGETTQTVEVAIIGDVLDELDEAFSLNLSNGNNVTIAETEAIATISDDDDPPQLIVEDIVTTEGSGIAIVTVSLNAPSSLPITVDYTTLDATATAGTDYTATSGTVEFLSGEMSQTIEVELINDSLDEVEEAFTLNFTNPTNVTVADSQSSITITDDDLPPEIAIADVTITEGNEGTTNTSFTISLSQPSSKSISVEYNTVEGTAIAGVDYIETAGTITFTPGETSKTIEVAVLGDTINELDEAFSFNLSNPDNATLTDDTGIATITDDDAAPSVSITDVSVAESDTETVNAVFNVIIESASSLPITVDFTTVDGTAIAGFDYIANSGTITFAPGETSKTIEVEVIGDNLDELDEAFSINLSNPSNATISDSEAIATITDNDTTPLATVGDISVSEDDTNATVTVTLDRASSKPITIDYITIDGTATAGIDYTATSGTVTFAPFETNKTINVSLLDDNLDEITEAFSLELSNPNNVSLGDDLATVTIIDNDAPPSITVSDFSIVEGDSQTQIATVTIALSEPSSFPISIDYSTNDGTALSGSDYIAANGTVEFAPGGISQTIEIAIASDTIDEIDETFSLNLSNPSNATIADNQATVTIIDNDEPPEVTISDITTTEGNNAVFTIALSQASSKTIFIDYNTSDGTAIAGEDYIATSGTITFAPGETSKTIEVPVSEDALDELDEAFSLNLSNPTNSTILDTEAIATINDNDASPQLTIGDISIAEGEAIATITVTLDTPSSLPISVDYTTVDGTAISGLDYEAVSGTVEFAPGETEKTIKVNLLEDTIDEINEAFALNFSNPNNVTLTDSQSNITIVDDDLSPEIAIADIDVTEGDSGTSIATVTVSLSNASSLPVTVDYSTADETAISGEDYEAISSTLTFAPGETSKTISLAVIGDTLDEVNERLKIELQNPSNGVIADEEGIVTITDNDLPPEIAIAEIAVTEADEGETTTATFTLSLSEASSLPITVDYNTVDGTATAGLDYTATSGIVTFAPGETNKTIDVAIRGDNLDEIDEAFSLNLSNPINSTIPVTEAIAIIEDNDNPPELTTGDISITEGDDSATTATVSVSLNAPSSQTITVDYVTTDGTATAGVDYETVEGTLTFAPGETSKTIEISILGDSLDEFNEAFTLNLSNFTNATLATTSSTIIIEDNDNPPSVVINDVSLVEGDEGTTNANFTLSLSQPSSKEIAIDYSTIDVTATAGVDYETVEGTLTFAPGETTKTIEVAVVGDTIDEIDEAFSLNLSNPSNVIIADGEGIATISDNDTAPSLSIDDVSVTESDAGTVNALFIVTLDSPSGQSISVDYTTVDGTAIVGFDYVASSGTLTFAPGETSQTIEVAISGDSIDEIDEAFSISLNNPVNALISDNEGTATIVDNDLTPEITVDGFTITEGDEGTKEANFTVSLSAISSQSVTVDYATSDNTATAGFDYTAISGTLTFAPGEVSKDIAVEIKGDLLDEPDEAFSLNLSNPSNGTLANTTAVGAIADDDLPPTITINSIVVAEGDTEGVNAVFEVSLSASSNLPITVEYTTLDGTAIALEDYQASNGRLTFAPGETSKTIVVPIVGDLINEDDETFSVRLSEPTNATLATTQGTATISDDDSLPTVAIDDLSVTESDTGTTTATFTVSLSEALATTATVDYTTSDNTATAGLDYIAKEGTVTFASGETTQTIEIEVIGDTVDEVDETFNANLSNPVNVLIDDGEGEGTIVDDDVLVAEPEGILLAEADNFRVEYTQSLIVPDASSVLTINYSDLNFDTTDSNSINDAFEIALLDSDGNSLVHTIGTERDAFFNLTEGEEVQLASGVTVEGETVRVNLTDVAPNTAANLVVRLVNNDGDINTSVKIDSIQIDSGDGSQPVAIANNVTTIPRVVTIDFATLSDVSPSLQPQYQQTSFNEETSILNAGLALVNEGTYHLDSSLIVVVKNLSNPSVRAVAADGLTPEGLPYYDFRDLLNEGKLAPGESTNSRIISFSNPDKVQFSYELEVLSQLNDAPSITSLPDLEIIGGQTYTYRVTAEDRDGDTLSYRLLTSPLDMSIDSNTGLIIWETTTEDVSNYAVVIEVSDGRGRTDLQTFNLAVTEIFANRPPQFTTTPVVDAYINQPYEYDADAIDPDSDSLNYGIIAAPDGLTIDPNSGKVEWTAPSVVVLGDTVIGQINLPGEIDEFTFSGFAGQRLYFDPLQYAGNSGNWSFDVFAPNGTQIIDTNLQNNQLIQLPETGNYRVVVDATSNNTGSYGFSAIDLDLTPVIPFDTVIEGQLSPGSEDDIYRFVGNEGQRIFIDKISNSGSVDWILYDAKNGTVASSSSMTDLEVVLPVDGEYKLALRGRANFIDNTDYAFEIITPDEITTEALLSSINNSQTISGSIIEKGERDIYTFEGKIGQAVFFDSLFFSSTSSNSHTINLTDPRGEIVWSRNLNSNDDTTPILLAENGTYKVRIDANGENKGTYSFNFLDFDRAMEIDLDTKYSDTLEPGQEAHLYQFTGIANQRIFLDSTRATGRTWRLYDSNLKQVDTTTSDDLELVLEKSDTYYLLVQGNNNNPVNYEFEIITPDEITTPMELGSIDLPATVTGAITEKGERDTYTFEGTIGQTIFFDALATSNNSQTIRLTDPAGTLIQTISPSSDLTTPILLEENGTYRVEIDASGEKIGDYSFNLLDFERATEINLDNSYSGTLELGRETHLYRFTASQNQRIYLESIENISNITWTLYDTTNKNILDRSFVSDLEVLIEQTGNYTLAIRGQSNNPLDYNFSLNAPNILIEELNLGQVTSGEISQKGERDVYTFTGAKDQKLFLDNLINSNNLTATLIDSRGNTVFNRVSLSGDTNRDPFDLPYPGDYRLIIDGNTEKTGSYNFQLLDLDNASELDTPSTTIGSIFPGSSTQVYKLSGYKGLTLSFQADVNNSSIPNWLIYSPGNSRLIDETLNRDFIHDFTSNDTHYLIIRGDGELNDTFDYQFNVTSSNTLITEFIGTEYTVGEVVESQTIDLSVLEEDNYRFTGTAGDTLYFDALENPNFRVNWQLIDPNEQFVFGSNTDANLDKLITLSETGDYILKVYTQTPIDNIESYSFRVFNWSNATSIDKDEIINGDFGLSKRETDFYRFNGVEEERVFFNSLDGDSSNNWKLYSDLGIELNSAQLSSTSDFEQTLPYTGEYFIGLSGNNRNNNNYSFELITNEWSTTNYTIGETISGAEIAIDEPGDRDDYTFEATAGDIFYFDALENTNVSIDWKLVNTDGKVIFNENASQDKLVNFTQTGTYTNLSH